MVPARYPPAVWRPVSYASTASVFPRTPTGWVLHVTVMDGSPWSTFESAVSPNRRFSHLWVAKDGYVEQYADLGREAWHAAGNSQPGANPLFWGVETEGFPGEPLTDAQLDSLAAWHAWCGAPDHIATTPTEGGISCHYLGGAAWGAHSCPDPSPGGQGPRSHQRAEIIRRANGGTDMPLTPQDLAAIADIVEVRYQVHVGSALETRDQALADIIVMLQQLQHGSPVVLDGNQVTGVASAVAGQVLAQLGPAVAKALADELAKRLGNG